jgi:hypothetical protein
LLDGGSKVVVLSHGMQLMLRSLPRDLAVAEGQQRRFTNSVFSQRIFSDILALSLPYPMPIAKHPSRKTKMSDKRAEKFHYGRCRQ